MTRWLAIVGLALATACGPGHSEESSTTTSGGPAGSTTAAPTTSGPVVTGAPGSSGGPNPSEPEATTTGGATVDVTVTSGGPGETSTTDVDGTSTSSTSAVPCEDTIGEGATTSDVPADAPQCADPQIEWNGEHVDCLVDCSTMTQIHGAGPAAGLPVITQASFGVAHHACGEGLALRRLRLGSLAKPQVDLHMFLECGLDPWLGEYAATDMLSDNTPIEFVLTIAGYSGDWISNDPIDPPRLFGSFSGDLVGPFEAVHCAKLDTYGPRCG